MQTKDLCRTTDKHGLGMHDFLVSVREMGVQLFHPPTFNRGF